MSKAIKPTDLAKALQQELTTYHEDVSERVNEVGRDSIKKLQRLTKANAPVASGSYKRRISTKEEDSEKVSGLKKFIWYVKSPDHRLTHLLVKGHVTRNGGRTKPDPFLQNALDEVLPEYERNTQEAIKNG